MAGGALAAEVVRETFAIGGLGEHARESEFADAARAGKEQCVGDTFATESAAERGDNAFVSEKLGKTHGLAPLAGGSRGKDFFDGGENVPGDFFRFANRAERGIETLNGGPGRATRKRVVHFGGVFEVAKTGFEEIFARGGVAAGGFAFDEPLGFLRGNAQVEDETFAGKAVNGVLEMLDPLEEFRALGGGDASGLMSEVGADIAVHQNNLAVVQGGFELRFGFEAVAGVEQSGEVGIDAFERAEIAIQELTDHFAEPGIVLGEGGGIDGVAASLEGKLQEFDLRALATAIDAFDGDEYSGSDHFGLTAGTLAAEGQSNRRNSALQCRAC